MGGGRPSAAADAAWAVQLAEGNPYDAIEGNFANMKIMTTILKTPITQLKQKKDKYSKDFQDLLNECLQFESEARSWRSRQPRCRTVDWQAPCSFDPPPAAPCKAQEQTES
jgi:hypothetical protein